MDLHQQVGRLRAAGRAATVMAKRPISASGALVFAYHDIVASRAECTEYAVDVERFRRQLEMTRTSGHRFVTLGEIVDLLNAGQSIDGLAAVTFDDALEGVRRHAAPVLAELRVPATVFVVTDVLGQDPPWWPGSGPIMARAGLEELAAAGVHLGSHTQSHASLPTLERKVLETEIVDSKAALEAITGSPIEHLAYPYGHFSPLVRDTASEAGYTAAFTFLNGRTIPNLDPFRLPRLTVGNHHNAARWAYHLARDPDSWPDTQLDDFTGR